jgi:hypothetical protein
MKQDMFVVVAATGEHASPDERAVLRLILRDAGDAAHRAFSAGGAQRDAAWKHVVLAVAELLWNRVQFPPASDRAECARLQAFVNENADAFERPGHPRVIEARAVI